MTFFLVFFCGDLCNFFTLLPHPSTLNAYKGTPKWGYLKAAGGGRHRILEEQVRASGPAQEGVSGKRPAGPVEGCEVLGDFTSLGLSFYDSEKDSRWACEAGHGHLPCQIS